MGGRKHLIGRGDADQAQPQVTSRHSTDGRTSVPAISNWPASAPSHPPISRLTKPSQYAGANLRKSTLLHKAGFVQGIKSLRIAAPWTQFSEDTGGQGAPRVRHWNNIYHRDF